MAPPFMTEERPLAAPESAPIAWRRNFISLVLDATLFFFALAMVDSSSVLPALVARLTDQPFLIGFLGSLFYGGWLLPQLFVARFAATRPRKLPWVIAATTTGRLFWLILFAALALHEQIPAGVIIAVCYLSVIGFWFMDGIAALLWYDLIGRTVPPRVRGRLFGLMSFFGGVMALGSGYVVQQIVGSPSLPFPTDYQMLVGLALVGFLIGVVPLLFIQEPTASETTQSSTSPAEPLGAYFRGLIGVLRERRDFRLLIVVQLLVGWTGLAVPFYAPYGLAVLKLAESDLGVFVAATAIGTTVGGLAWGYLGDHGRHHIAVRGVAALTLAAPASALLVAWMAPAIGPSVLALAYGVPFFLVGASVRGAWVAFSNYLLEIAGPNERAKLVGLMNTLSGSLALAPSVGGLLAGWFGYEVTFVAALVPTAIGAFVSFRLHQPVSAAHEALEWR